MMVRESFVHNVNVDDYMEDKSKNIFFDLGWEEEKGKDILVMISDNPVLATESEEE